MKEIAQDIKPCAPDYDVSSIRGITIDDEANYVSNEIEIEVDRPCYKFYKWFHYDVSLEHVLPGVTTKPINDKKPWENGHRRIVCTGDGNTMIEEVVEHIPEKYDFYKVWNYSDEFLSERVEYAKGEFWYTPKGNKTHIRWRYSFKLRNEKYRQEYESFVQGFWNDFMIWNLDHIKNLSEKEIHI